MTANHQFMLLHTFMWFCIHSAIHHSHTTLLMPITAYQNLMGIFISGNTSYLQLVHEEHLVHKTTVGYILHEGN